MARTSARKSRQTRTPRGASTHRFPIVCQRCGGAIIDGQQIASLFSPRLVRWAVHPVLSKPPTIRGMIALDGSPGRSDLSLGEQLRQRAAMGGEKERRELAAFEALWVNAIAEALVAQLREEAAAHGTDVVTWLARKAQDEG